MNTKRLLAAALSLLLITVTPLAAQAQDGAPIPENLKLETYRGVSMEGQLRATDPEGDPVTFQLAPPPVKGEIFLEKDGSFVYTPAEGKWGKDYFGYTATDANGNVSQEGTVIISLVKPKTNVTYSDLEGLGCYYDALRLADAGIFIGEQLGTSHVFSPNTPVTRGEFLAMCMNLANEPILSGASNTGYNDNDAIPTWQKAYVATACMTGTLTPGEDECFNGDSPITCAQAAVMISNALKLSTATAAVIDADTPTWATNAVTNLTACHILPASCDTNQTVTRAMAADMLSAAIDAAGK